MMVACQWKRSSPTGPAEHWAGGSLPISFSSLDMRFKAIVSKRLDYPRMVGQRSPYPVDHVPSDTKWRVPVYMHRYTNELYKLQWECKK